MAGCREKVLDGTSGMLNGAESALVEAARTWGSKSPRQRRSAAWPDTIAHLPADPAWDPVTALRVRLPIDMAADVARIDAEGKDVVRHLDRLVDAVGSSLGELVGLSTRSVASCSGRPMTPAV